ncbi:polysaccharide biosynthesis tyrosine autokinase [Rhodoferax aquaticus]|uniref:Polysaccharide biosynthesis tyrosine autokinase n=1 Tax=Rhodoferax aquaticus TaxID=2527691 RepID=A0A515ELA3_9BURK|nr:polysaccharide biosynthesis tyrosine autokinase [Rhodoferax aquaticus]QDL53399.1 polysaccharide biosynthesis tyrosine autokinase [Rhodoferax aquaticus]
MSSFDPQSSMPPLPSIEPKGGVPLVLESRMGDACIASQRLTRAEVDQVLALQNQKQMRFGEAAIALGLLTSRDVRELLNTQFNNDAFSSAALLARISPSLAIVHAPDSDAAQAIKRLRSDLLVEMDESQKLVLAVLSPAKREGKSYTAASLAIAFAQLNIKTLLIDANLREPCVHRLLGLPNQTGLSTVLARRSPGELGAMEELVPGFWILGSGPVPPNPLEMLTAPAFRQMLAPLIDQVSVIIVDTPAGSQWADAQTIAGQTGAAILVARKDQTLVSELREFQRALEGARVDVLGVVFNQVLKPQSRFSQQSPWSHEETVLARVWRRVTGLFSTGAA